MYYCMLFYVKHLISINFYECCIYLCYNVYCMTNVIDFRVNSRFC